MRNGPESEPLAEATERAPSGMHSGVGWGGSLGSNVKLNPTGVLMTKESHEDPAGLFDFEIPLTCK